MAKIVKKCLDIDGFLADPIYPRYIKCSINPLIFLDLDQNILIVSFITQSHLKKEFKS